MKGKQRIYNGDVQIKRYPAILLHRLTWKVPCQCPLECMNLERHLVMESWSYWLLNVPRFNHEAIVLFIEAIGKRRKQRSGQVRIGMLRIVIAKKHGTEQSRGNAQSTRLQVDGRPCLYALGKKKRGWMISESLYAGVETPSASCFNVDVRWSSWRPPVDARLTLWDLRDGLLSKWQSII